MVPVEDLLAVVHWDGPAVAGPARLYGGIGVRYGRACASPVVGPGDVGRAVTTEVPTAEVAAVAQQQLRLMAWCSAGTSNATEGARLFARAVGAAGLAELRKELLSVAVDPGAHFTARFGRAGDEDPVEFSYRVFGNNLLSAAADAAAGLADLVSSPPVAPVPGMVRPEGRAAAFRRYVFQGDGFQDLVLVSPETGPKMDARRVAAGEALLPRWPNLGRPVLLADDRTAASAPVARWAMRAPGGLPAVKQAATAAMANRIVMRSPVPLALLEEQAATGACSVDELFLSFAAETAKEIITAAGPTGWYMVVPPLVRRRNPADPVRDTGTFAVASA